MSDANASTHPTVYAYLDLAVQDEKRDTWRVPQSDGGEWISTRESGAYRYAVSEVKLDGACHVGSHGVIGMMGALALEVAEREVREAADKWKRRMRTVSRIAKDRTLDGEDAVFIRYGDKEVEDGAYRASVYPELSRAVDLRDRLRAKLAGPASLHIDYASGPSKTHLVMSTLTGLVQEFRSTDAYKTVEAARANGICRICGLKPECGPGLPFVYDHGREHAHEACIAQERKSLNQEAKPMPTVNYRSDDAKPDPIKVKAVCDFDSQRVTLYIIDRSRRSKCALVPAGVSRTTHPDEMDVSVRWVEVQEGARIPAFLRVSMEAFDNLSIVKKALAELLSLSYATLPPLVVEGTSPQACEKIAEDFKREQPGRSVIVLPHGARVADAPPDPYASQPVASDIALRADIAAASHKSLRVGGILGLVAGLSLACIALGAVAKLKPEWLVPKRTPVVMDEHARESEDARAK